MTEEPDATGPPPDPRSPGATTVVSLSLRDIGEATEVSLSQGEFATGARLAPHQNGWTDSLDKLGDLVGGADRGWGLRPG